MNSRQRITDDSCPGRYLTAVPNPVIDMVGQIGVDAFALYVVIARACAERGYADLSPSTLARRLRVPVVNVRAWRAILVADGLLEFERGCLVKVDVWSRRSAAMST